MQTKNDYAGVDAWLSRRSHPLLVSHQRPDGDALGALAAMSRGLAKRGRRASIALFDPFPPRYAMLRDATPWFVWDDIRPRFADYDGLVIVDTCARAQLPPLADLLDVAPPTLVLDHHATPDEIALRDGDLRLIDTSAAAVCVLAAEWLLATGGELDSQLATALFIGIATDCGWFKFPNTDGRALHLVARLVDAGAELDPTYRAIYEQDPPEKLALIARMFESMQLLGGGRLAVATLREADFAATGADPSLTEDLANETRRLGGVEATLMFTEMGDGVIRLNLRSKEWLNVSELAREFGGGGHPRAAGARVTGDWDDIVARVTAAALARLGE